MSRIIPDELLDRLLLGDLSEQELAQLRAGLQQSEQARREYWQAFEQHVLLEDVLREARGQDLALLESGTLQSEAKAEPRPSKLTLKSVAWKVFVPLMAASLLVALGFYFWQTDSNSKVVAATLRSATGTVQIRSAEGKYTLAASGTRLAQGEAVVVDAEESSAELVLNDGSTAILDSDSILVLTQENRDRQNQVHLERGGMQLLTQPQPPERPLLVTSPQARVIVKGTRFRLYCDAQATRIELNEGSARFERNSDGQAVEVSEGFAVDTMSFEQPTQHMQLVAKPLSQASCQLQTTLLRAGRVATLSHDGQELGTANNREMRRYDLSTGKLLSSIQRHNRPPPIKLAFTADKQALVELGGSGISAVWPAGETAAEVTRARSDNLRDGALANDGLTISQCINTDEGQVAIWSLDPIAKKFELVKTLRAKPWNSAVANRPLGTAENQQPIVAVGRWGGVIEVHDPARSSAELLRVRGTPQPLAISATGQYIAANAADQGLTLFERSGNSNVPAMSSQVLWSVKGARVRCLCFSRDGKLLLAGMDDGLLRAWSVETGESLLVLESGESRITGLALSSDNTTLITVGDRETVKIWRCEWPLAIQNGSE